DLRDRGLREPVPLPLQTAAAWAEKYLRSGSEEAAYWAARKEWTTEPRGFAKEQHGKSHEFVLGGVVPIEDILGTPAEDERWEPKVTTRLRQLALRVWRPILEDRREECYLSRPDRVR